MRRGGEEKRRGGREGRGEGRGATAFFFYPPLPSLFFFNEARRNLGMRRRREREKMRGERYNVREKERKKGRVYREGV